MALVCLQEKANFTRLSRLLVDKGTEALRNTFDTLHSPLSLPAVLVANRASLLRLKLRVINNSQWDLLFPPSGSPPDSKTFDVTLLTVLFRNICGLTSTGWDKMPLPTDSSMQANIVRIKLLRNEVYAHVTSTRVDNATFESLWQNIAQALVELNIPQNDVDDLKTCPVGPEEEVYVKILQDWKIQEDQCIILLGAIECSVNRLSQITDEVHQSALEQQNNMEILQRSIITDEDILRKLAKHNFKSKIRSKVKFFLPGTREWLFVEVDRWFHRSDDDSKMLLFTAGPGFGKSVFAANICKEFKKNKNLAACHFCDFSNSNLRDPMMMLQSLASQMCENIVGFKAKLLDQLKRPHRVQNLKDAFRIYLQNPLDEMELEEPSLVVIDGLDESAADDKNEIMNLIADYFPDLPEYIKIFVTSRPEISVSQLSGVQKIDIANNDAKNNTDLELYFQGCLPSLADKKIDWNDIHRSKRDKYADFFEQNEITSVLSAVVEKCEGSFLYAYHIQSELQTRDDLENMTFFEIIEFLPRGLDSIYQAYFNRLEDELTALKHKNFDVLKILELLASSKGPLPLTFVAQAIGLAPDCRETKDIINKINETVSCLLYVSDDILTVFHKSVVDWLLAKGYKDHRYTVKVGDGNRSLWLLCENVFEGIVKRIYSGRGLDLTNDVKYALDHGFLHLIECNMEESMFWSVDVIIMYAVLIFDPEYRSKDKLLKLWERILQSSVAISDKLRARISWHVVEFHCIDFYAGHFFSYTWSNLRFYLESVLSHSPEGYFSDNEMNIAELLLSDAPPFVELNSYEVEVLPRAFWHVSPATGSEITAVAVSYDRKMVAMGLVNGKICVLSAQSLSEIWICTTEYGRISCCTFSPDDSFVLFGKLKAALSITKRKEVPFFHGNDETFMSCAFSPNWKRLITSNGSNTIKLWDIPKQRLLASLCAEVPVNWCSFSKTGLFIIGDWKHNPVAEDSSIQGSEFDEEESFSEEYSSIENSEFYRKDLSCETDSTIEDSKSGAEDSFCVWNTITCQRSDKRELSNGKMKKPRLQSKKCQSCCQSGFHDSNASRRLEIQPCLPSNFLSKPWYTGAYNSVEYYFTGRFERITAVEDDLWLYVGTKKLFVFKTLAPIQEECSRQSLPTKVYSSSFSPDCSRLAACTSKGNINIWNVYTSDVEQRFQVNQSGSSFACWWSNSFLYVFDFFERIPSLKKYPVDVNLEVLFTQSQEVSLCHLVNEFLPLSAVVAFSEGFLSFECGETEPVKVLNINEVNGPRMVTLPGIQPMMSIVVSPYGAFVFGGNKDTYYIWKRNAEEPALYEAFVHEDLEHFVCCFSNNSKVSVVIDRLHGDSCKVIDLDTGTFQSVCFESIYPVPRIYCVTKDRVVIAVFRYFLAFFDMDSGALISWSFQRYLTDDVLLKTKLSPKETMLAFPNLKGDMVFLPLCIPPNHLLFNIKREAAIAWRDALVEDSEEET